MVPAWLAFGEGTGRCIGADFGIAAIDTVPRTVPQNFRIPTDTAADEKPYFAGIAHVPKPHAPKHVGLVVLNRRK